MADLAEQLRIDIDRRTTRGRACPRCGGKIIPSRRAVYQSTGDPNAVFPAWQCERCGYEELLARPVVAPKHGAAPAKTANQKAAAATSSTPAAAAAPKVPALRAVPALKDRKGRPLPPDVNRMMAEMTREVNREQ